LSGFEKLSESWVVLGHRLAARRAAKVRIPTSFVTQPEPRTIGIYARGRQLLAGNFLFAGTLIEAPDRSIWELSSQAAEVNEIIHGFTWLDDLAAVGDANARAHAQTWVQEWISLFGSAKGPGWTPSLAGRRLIRWINHGIFLLKGSDQDQSERLFLSLAQQTIFLSKRWHKARTGLPRFEALCGVIYASLSLSGMASHAREAIEILAKDCQKQIGADGGIISRNPEELLEVFALLNWVVIALNGAGLTAPAPISSALERIAPALRAVRHTEGGLARFHGGGRGIEGRLDHALSTSGIPTLPSAQLYMGFARLAAGRTSLVLDSASPPSGTASHNAHASTLAFELSSGRRQLIVNCGSGVVFGQDWRQAGRATVSHSTLSIDGFSSSRLAPGNRVRGITREYLIEVPDKVPAEFTPLSDGRRLEAAHNGYQLTHGLTHARTLDMSSDGRAISGEDLLTTLSKSDRAIFDSAMDREESPGIPFTIRFHLHPEVLSSIDLGGSAISLTLRSGEIWIFRHDSKAEMRIEPSVYLENGRLRPREAEQVVLSGRAMSYSTRVRWSLSKAQDTPTALRDFLQKDQPDTDVP